MGGKSFRWCPNGCGKSVMHDPVCKYPTSAAFLKPYLCERCNKRFNKQEVSNKIEDDYPKK